MDTDEVQPAAADVAGALASAHQATLLQASEGADEDVVSLKVSLASFNITFFMLLKSTLITVPALQLTAYLSSNHTRPDRNFMAYGGTLEDKERLQFRRLVDQRVGATAVMCVCSGQHIVQCLV